MLPAERRLGQILGALLGGGAALSWVGLNNMASGGGGGGAAKKITSLAAAESKAPADALTNPEFPPEWPYTSDDLRRRDESSDLRFYDQPRLVTHIDDSAIAALTAFYSQQPVFAKPEAVALLDVASSWISHYPPNFDGSVGRVALLGMNQYELEQNRQGTDEVVKDLNTEPASVEPSCLALAVCLSAWLAARLWHASRTLLNFNQLAYPYVGAFHFVGTALR